MTATVAVTITTQPLVGGILGQPHRDSPGDGRPRSAASPRGWSADGAADDPGSTGRRSDGAAVRGDVLAGLVAIVALAALTIGVPFALVTVVGLPMPHTMPCASPAHPASSTSPRS